MVAFGSQFSQSLAVEREHYKEEGALKVLSETKRTIGFALFKNVLQI